MASPSPTPRHLVEALQQRSGEARQQLRQALAETADRLMGECLVRYGLMHDRQQLTHYALSSIETYLRTRALEEFEGLSWSAFLGACLVHLAKMTSLPSVGPSERRVG